MHIHTHTYIWLKYTRCEQIGRANYLLSEDETPRYLRAFLVVDTT